jgi:hypothetical protein
MLVCGELDEAEELAVRGLRGKISRRSPQTSLTCQPRLVEAAKVGRDRRPRQLEDRLHVVAPTLAHDLDCSVGIAARGFPVSDAPFESRELKERIELVW